MGTNNHGGERGIGLQLLLNPDDHPGCFQMSDLAREKRAGEPIDGRKGLPLDYGMDNEDLWISVRAPSSDSEQRTSAAAELLRDHGSIF
jgi:hypothetical protein